LVWSLALFIPAGSIGLDAQRLTRDLRWVFFFCTVLYVIEAIIKPLDVVSHLTPLHEVQVHKSLVCVLALCLSILTGRMTLAFITSGAIVAAIILRPMSTLVLALIVCVPIAIVLRSRVIRPRITPVIVGFAASMMTWIAAVSIPLLLYFFFDDIADFIGAGETYLKSDVIGGQSNMAFRLAILKIAYSTITDAWTFIFGNGLLDKHTVPLGQIGYWQWWYNINPEGEAPIHSDFSIVFIEMGIIGYFFLSIAFLSALWRRFRDLTRAKFSGYAVVIQSISIIGILTLMIYISDEPSLRYYNHTQSIWLLLLISEVASKSLDTSKRTKYG
jgi:hypothetical protein